MAEAPADPEETRPVPFVLRVAARWVAAGDLPREDDGPLLYRERMALTGGVSLTDRGHDVHFSDLGLTSSSSS
jgi:hypothetical protein